MRIIIRSLFLMLIFNTAHLYSIEDIHSEKFKECVVEIVKQKYHPRDKYHIVGKFHLYSLGLFDLSMFNHCLPSNWRTLSQGEQNQLKNHIQQIFRDAIQNHLQSSRIYVKTPLIKNEPVEARNQRYADFTTSLDDEMRYIILENGIELRYRDQPNFIELETLYPAIDPITLNEAKVETETRFFIEENIINAILDQQASEEESLALAALMADVDQRRNTGLAQTITSMLGSEPKFPKNLPKGTPKVIVKPKLPATPKILVDHPKRVIMPFDTEHLTRAVKVARQLNLTAEQSPKTKHIKQTTHSKSFDPTMATTIRAYDFRNKSRNADQIPAAKEKTKKSTITFIDSDTIENHFHHTKNISQK